MAEREKFYGDDDWTWETDLDDTSDEGGFGAYVPQEGDVLICCVEDLELFKGPAGPYSATVLRIVAGPLNDESRNAGPFISDKDNKLYSLRMWDNLSFSSKAAFRLKPFLRAVGHSGPVRLKAARPDHDEDPLPETQFQEIACDREIKVSIKLEEDNKGKDQMKPDEYSRLSASDWAIVEKTYGDFGPARGMRWNDKRPDDVEPIVPWTGVPAAAPGNDMGNANF